MIRAIIPHELLVEVPEDYEADAMWLDDRHIVVKGRRIRRPSAEVIPNKSSEQWHGLVAWWPTIQVDHAGTSLAELIAGKNGAFVDAPAWTSEESLGGHSLLFDGTNDAVQAASVNLSAYGAISLAFWMYWDTFANDDDLAFEFTANYNSNPGGLIVDPNDANGAFRTGVNNQDADKRVMFEFTRPSAGAWHHYVFTYDISQNATHTGSAFVDGASAAGFTYLFQGQGSVAGVLANSTLNFMSRNGASLFGAGRLADVRIYNRLLSAAEAERLYNPQTRWELYL